MSFNIDDPLAGILSDGSDDSFFDDDVLGKKKPAKKKSTPTLEKKNALFDLQDTDKPKAVASTLDKKESLFNIDSNKSPSPFKRTLSKESIKFSQSDPKVKVGLDKLDLSKSPAKSKVSASADKLDVLSELSGPKRETSKPIDKGKSSQSLLDDILGGPSTKSGASSSQATRPVTAAKSQEFDFDSILGKSETKAPTSIKSQTQKKNVKENKKEDKEVPAMKTKSTEDWLGIFQDKDDGNDDLEDDSGMPSWLVGGDSKKKKAGEKKAVSKAEPAKEKSKPLPQTEEQTEVDTTTMEVKKDIEIMDQMSKLSLPVNVLHGSNEDVAAEGATLYMQQQESQLMVALQLKAQEEKLAAMQSKWVTIL